MRLHPRLLLLLAQFTVLGTVSGCGYLLRSPDRPTPAIYYRSAEARSDCIMVLLPGFFDSPEEFARHGVVDDLRAVTPQCDLVAVDSHIYDYRDGSVVERVYEDIVLTARRRGYRHVWLVGVSMGALGAVLTAREHPDAFDGVVLLSPYLGTPSFIETFEREVEASGGLHAWARQQPESAVDSRKVLADPRPVWRWLAEHQRTLEKPPLWIGYATGDRFAPAHRLLASVIDEEHALVVDGSHDWETWRRICQDVFVHLPVESELVEDSTTPRDEGRPMRADADELSFF